ncbi:L-threonylcarbamoyladenylate synthase [Ichthyenterobacterium sp. W332]|uniref:L-threonylcarbamoyladenylate synthase n=1 Tax=Microcosmobacter mediterraneus TaxID=3075607 RepID=A0ABU2YMX8_9FLAO|nr:L-threonylcarbamoyladenylate synthase [Ichthyenterobacterium sp. W332]MDT0559520.1 L-threonylcarbamoyladenylate synthase [Ichthyenterobacterium sp. W332]
MKHLLEHSISVLKKSGTLLYPTDTVWGIGCDATNYNAVKKIYELKKREETKALICLVSDFKMLQQYVEDVPEMAYDILKYANKPTTIIYDRPKGIAENLIAKDNTLAIRIVRQGFAHQLIKKLRRPLVSTSANISGESSPKSFKEISQEILKGVDYVVNLQNENKKAKPSTIIKLSNDGMVKIIRK